MKIMYVVCRSNLSLYPVARKALKHLKGFKKIGVVSTAQHLWKLSEVLDELKNAGKEPVLGGQITGCNLENAVNISDKVDVYLYIGSGRFHPQGLLEAVDKTIYTADPYTHEIHKLDAEDKAKLLKKKKACLGKAASAQVYGILVSTKTGQCNMEAALKIKKQLEEKGREAYIFAGEEITPERVEGLKVDVYVNTACPRITGDFFNKPVINWSDLKEIL